MIAIERADRRVIRLLELAEEIHVPAAVVAQAWRNPARQVRLVRVLATDPVHVHALDNEEARAVGHLCGASGTSDVVDASVVLLARRVGGVTVSSDPDGLHVIDPRPQRRRLRSGFLDDKRYNSNQIEFVNLVIDELTQNGVIEPADSTSHPSPT